MSGSGPGASNQATGAGDPLAPLAAEGERQFQVRVGAREDPPEDLEDERVPVDERGVGLFGVQHPGCETGRDRGGPLEAQRAEAPGTAEALQQHIGQPGVVQRVVDDPSGERAPLHPADQRAREQRWK